MIFDGLVVDIATTVQRLGRALIGLLIIIAGRRLVISGGVKPEEKSHRTTVPIFGWCLIPMLNSNNLSI